MRTLCCDRGVKLFTLRIFAVARVQPGGCGQGENESKANDSKYEPDGVKEKKIEQQSAHKGEGGERGCGLSARRGGRRGAWPGPSQVIAR